jgi:glycosyltransferase involved in cell wall biosynthesis
MAPVAPSIVSVFDVEPRFIGGTETYARELSRQLGRQGWRSVLCFVTPPTEEVRRFLDLPNVSIELLHQDVTRFNFQVMARVARILRRYKPRIAHFHYVDLLSLYPWVARLASGADVFFTDHGSRPEGHRSERASLSRRCLARAINWPVTKVICVSDYGYRSLVDRGLFPEGRCQRIYNGVDLSRVVASRERAGAFRRRFSIPEGRTVITQVSWIIPEKGIVDLLRAARLVVAEHPASHFVIVGEGAFRDEYMAKGRELGLDGHLTWTGLIEDPFTAGVYDATDILCQASRWGEVFGWVIAEAMAYGRPVVATRVGGIPEVVSEHESGYLIDRGDVRQLMETLLRLVADPGRRRTMGAAGREKVGVKFDLQKNVAHLLEAYGICPLTPPSGLVRQPQRM